MKMDENLAAVHAYLCADGHVTKSLPQKQKHYTVGLRNTNLIILQDFKKRFDKVFNTQCHPYGGQKCQKGSKEIYELLTNQFGSFYSWHWTMPKLEKDKLRIWLRAYFDCEGGVFCKKHQNRHIGVDCINKIGIEQI
jgi:hypothetical protein